MKKLLTLIIILSLTATANAQKKDSAISSEITKTPLTQTIKPQKQDTCISVTELIEFSEWLKTNVSYKDYQTLPADKILQELWAWKIRRIATSKKK